MNLIEKNIIISKTKQWILDVVIGCNFCPFAAKEVKKDSVYYEVLENLETEKVLEKVFETCSYLDTHEEIETSLLILSNCFTNFDEYLVLVELAEDLLAEYNYDGIYQIASFHPQYLFSGSNEKDPSNYTNRSPYPMLHFLREDSIRKAVDSYPNIEDVPKRNIKFTQEKGLEFMVQQLRNLD